MKYLMKVFSVLWGLMVLLPSEVHAEAFSGISITGLGGYGYSIEDSKTSGSPKGSISGTHIGGVLSAGGNLFSTPIFLGLDLGLISYLSSSPAKGALFIEPATRLGLNLDNLLIYGRLGTLIRMKSLVSESTTPEVSHVRYIEERLKSIEVAFGTFWGLGIDIKFGSYFFGGLEYLCTSFYNYDLGELGKATLGALLGEGGDELKAKPGHIIRVRLGIVF